jgi:hypothetical protein
METRCAESGTRPVGELKQAAVCSETGGEQEFEGWPQDIAAIAGPESMYTSERFEPKQAKLFVKTRLLYIPALLSQGHPTYRIM